MNSLIVVNTEIDLVTKFLANLTNDSTRRAYRADLVEFFGLYGNQFSSPNDITILHLAAYRDYLKSQGKTSATICRKASSISSFLTFCVQENVLSYSPATSLKKPRIMTEAPTAAFTDEEALLLIQAPDSKTFYGNSHKMIFCLLFLLALRRSEIVKIQLKDFFEDRGTRLLRVHGKGDKIRNLPLSQEFVAHLDAYLEAFQKLSGRALEANDYLVQGHIEKSYNPICPTTIFKIVSRYKSKVGITKRVSPHSCRATTISQLLENGESPRNVADFAGHSNIETTMLYDKKRDGHKNSSALRVKYGV